MSYTKKKSGWTPRTLLGINVNQCHPILYSAIGCYHQLSSSLPYCTLSVNRHLSVFPADVTARDRWWVTIWDWFHGLQVSKSPVRMTWVNFWIKTKDSISNRILVKTHPWKCGYDFGTAHKKKTYCMQPVLSYEYGSLILFVKRILILHLL